MMVDDKGFGPGRAVLTGTIGSLGHAMIEQDVVELILAERRDGFSRKGAHFSQVRKIDLVQRDVMF